MVNGASELSRRPKHSLKATREAKFGSLTFLLYNYYFLLRNYMMLEFIFEERK